ncbi:MAG TPA: thioredoxin family protein [Desulfomonilaceae bacterium]|nr:thioredoxin family protein [Desulfomonilaceae bacterium]
MVDETSLKIIQFSAAQLAKPVRLIVFTKDSGCLVCQNTAELARAIKAHMGRIALETYDLVMDRDKTEQYGIQRVPALVVQGEDDQTVTFYGSLKNICLDILLHTIHAVSAAQVWLPGDIRQSLRRLTDKVKIRVFVRNDCLQCKAVAEIAIGLALESTRVDTSLITIEDFPELAKKYNITVLPKTIFGEGLQVEGYLSESDFLVKVFQAEGAKSGPDNHCLVCGTPSLGMICSSCKTRIQAEALDHKLKIERQKQPDIP